MIAINKLSYFISLAVQPIVFGEDVTLGSWRWDLVTLIFALVFFRKKIRSKNRE
jgi:hypothetical protein